MISLVETTLKFRNKGDALKFHLLAISTEENLKLSSADIEVAIEIYNNGYTKELFTVCVSKGFFKSEQTVRNSVAKLTKKGILLKGRKDRKVNPKFLPQSKESDFVLKYIVKYDYKNV
jgi:hypothetical protein